MIVISLLGILSVIVIPNFTNLKDHSKTAEAKSALASLARNEQSYFFINGEYSDDLNEINFHFEPSFYRVGFGKTNKSDPDKQIYRGPAGVKTSLSENCYLTPNLFDAGSSNDMNISNFTINELGCLRELKKGEKSCSQPKTPKVCL